MGKIGKRAWVAVCYVAVSLLLWRAPGNAVNLDSEGDIKLGVRTYVNTRVGTEDTHQGVLFNNPGTTTPSGVSASGTFPFSAAGHVRQIRSFIEAELNHDLDPLVKRGVGPFSLLSYLPFQVKNLGYHLTFRGEGDNVYDWGPREYSTAEAFRNLAAVELPNPLVHNSAQEFHNVPMERERLRHLGTSRERLFQAYLEGNVGNLFLRFGRQILSWGETDGFRLLDNINPLDNSFGGFLISLDERRVPLDMLRAQYFLGDIGPFSEAFIEAYGAIDNSVGFYPGTPAGSPWALPSLGAPSINNNVFVIRPATNFKQMRGGARLVFNVLDATFSLANYWTREDTPALQVSTSGYNGQNAPPDNSKTLLNAFNDGRQCLNPTTGQPDPNNFTCGSPAHTVETAPLVMITGATSTFALPQFYSVVRSEVAYFKDEPAFTQGQLDPFIFNLGAPRAERQQTGGKRQRDSVATVIGLDRNQWIRFLNPNQTFFISTQFFYKRILKAEANPVFLNQTNAQGQRVINPNREVLPIENDLRDFFLGGTSVGRLEPIFIQQPQNQFLQTLFIGTSYRSGTINPGFTFFYDWSGSFVYQPSIQFSRDPFRLVIDYSNISAHTYKGGSGVSLLKDRDNIQFRFEYVI